MSETRDRIDAYHAHLDVCVQCREHSLLVGLCEVGARLLQDAAIGPREARAERDEQYFCCDMCEARAAHEEHFCGEVRRWCTEHTPRAHVDRYCGDLCRFLLESGRGGGG